LRAPTAETGARAIAGTINIVLREGRKATPDDLKITRSQEHDQGSSMLNWVHNLNTSPMSGTFTLSAMDNGVLTKVRPTSIQITAMTKCVCLSLRAVVKAYMPMHACNGKVSRAKH
jgi:hypothetical protein